MRRLIVAILLCVSPTIALVGCSKGIGSEVKTLVRAIDGHIDLNVANLEVIANYMADKPNLYLSIGSLRGAFEQMDEQSGATTSVSDQRLLLALREVSVYSVQWRNDGVLSIHLDIPLPERLQIRQPGAFIETFVESSRLAECSTVEANAEEIHCRHQSNTDSRWWIRVDVRSL
ncbi:MAG: hypothetical protein AAF290_16390 [Pseudomonadota bacterium]